MMIAAVVIGLLATVAMVTIHRHEKANKKEMERLMRRKRERDELYSRPISQHREQIKIDPAAIHNRRRADQDESERRRRSDEEEEDRRRRQQQIESSSYSPMDIPYTQTTTSCQSSTDSSSGDQCSSSDSGSSSCDSSSSSSSGCD